MSRVKAIYRSWAIPCTGKQVYAPRHRTEWLGKISEAAVRRRAEFYYQQLDALRALRQQVRRDLLAESKREQAWKRLCQIPSIGPIRAAVLLGVLQTPHRFRTKRQLWTYSGFGIETQSSADHRSVNGQLQRAKKQISIRGLNRNCNHDLRSRAGSTGRCNTTDINIFLKGGVHDAETMEAVFGPAGRYVEPLESRRVVKCDWSSTRQG